MSSGLPPRGRGKRAPRNAARIEKDLEQMKKRKPWHNKIDKKQAAALEKVGSAGGDPRLPSDASVNPEADIFRDEAFNIVMNPPLTQKSYWGPLLFIVSQSFTKGFVASAQANNNAFAPFYAFQYLVSVLESAINNTEPLVTEAPIWFVVLYQALRPGKVPFRTGAVSYKFNVDASGPFGFGQPVPTTIPWDQANTAYAFGSPDGDGSNIDGYNILVLPAPYTLELGQTSFAQLLNYFANTKIYPMWKLVPLSEPLRKRGFDASAYAATSPEIGGSVLSGNGYVTELFSEVHVNAPLLSLFTQYETDLYRTHSQTRMYGGGGCYVGGRLSQMQHLGEITAKIRPIFKKCDFNEIFEVMALYLGNLLAIAQGNVLQEDGTAPLICPLTVQDFRIVLRQAIMSMFMESQSMTQDLQFSSNDTFYAFIVAAGTCGKEIGSQIVLPLILVENLRAMLRRTFRAKGKDGSFSGQMVDFCPVWGQWASDIPAISNYTYEFQGNTFPVFTTLVAEIPINITDGSVTVANTQYYLDLNGPELQNNVTMWNQFLSQLAANSSALSPIGSEKGISALEVVTHSFVMLSIPPPPPPEAQRAAGAPGVQTPKVSKRQSAERPKCFGKPPTQLSVKQVPAMPEGGVANSPYSNWSANFTCSNQKIVAASWSECQQYWVMPATRTNGQMISNSFYTSYQSEVCEPNFFYLGTVGSDVGVTNNNLATPLYNRHLNLANLMVNPVAARENTLEAFLVSAASGSRGGFLGKLAGELVGGLFGQSAAGGQIGDQWF